MPRPKSNFYEIKKDCVAIYNINYGDEPICLVDLEDLFKILNHTWYIHKSGYVICGKMSTSIHRHILKDKLSDCLVVDHIDENKKNNRKSNLRITTQGQNCKNRLISKNNKSGFNGVHFVEIKNRWLANIWVNKRLIHLGSFTKKSDAVEARIRAEIKYNILNKNNQGLSPKI